MEEKNIKKAYAAWIAICIIWGTTYLAIRIGVKNLPPVLFAGFRWFIAGPILFVVLKQRGCKLPNKKDLIHSAVIGILLLGGGNGFMVFAEQWIPSGLTALLVTTVPFWMIGIESFIPSSQKLNWITVFGLFCGLVGIILILRNDLHNLFISSNIKGLLSLMLSIFTWSIGTVYSKYRKLSTHPLMSASLQMIMAGFILTILGLFLGELNDLHFHFESLLAFTYLLIVGSLVGYGAYIYALAHLPISLVSTYAYINPILALFLGWLFLDEKITLQIFLGAAIILFGVGLVKKGSSAMYLSLKKVD